MKVGDGVDVALLDPERTHRIAGKVQGTAGSPGLSVLKEMVLQELLEILLQGQALVTAGIMPKDGHGTAYPEAIKKVEEALSKK